MIYTLNSIYKYIILNELMQDSKKGDGNMPVLFVSGNSIAEAWENQLWN